MTENTQENFQDMIQSKEMVKREPVSPPREDRVEEDFDNTVEAMRDRLFSLMMLNNVAAKVAQMKAQREKNNPQPRAA